MSILRSLERRGADPLLPWGSSYIPRNGETGLVVAGVTMNDDVALSITTVATCISLLSDGIATMTINGLKDTKDKSKKLLDPLPQLIKNPWPEGTRIDFFTKVMNSLLLRGNFYGLIVDRDAGGYPTMIQPVHPDRIFIRRNPNSGKIEYRINAKIIAAEDMVHIRSPLPSADGVMGLNPVEYQAQSWGLARAAEAYGAAVFQNSANPSGVIQTEQDLSPEETLEMARDWKQAHGGIGMAQRPAILTGGAKWQTISMTPDEAQFLATRTFQQQQIISWFRIPPHKIGVQDRSPGPVLTEELEMQYVTEGLLPWARRIEDVFDNLLRPSQLMRFDFSSRLRGNTLQRAQAAQIWLNTGAKTIDEVRASEDIEPLDSDLGNVIARPANMAYFDVKTGKLIVSPSADVGASNPGGVGAGGGDPSNSPDPTKPDS